MLVSRHALLIEYYRRMPEDWLLTIHEGLDVSLPLPTLPLLIPMTEIYDCIEFDAEAHAP